MSMSRIWRTLKGYLFWTYDRGSFHYDVMVTLILLFIFVAPRFIDFKDQPAGNLPHRVQVLAADGRQELVYEVDAAQVDAQDEDMVRVNFQRALRPIAGAVIIDRLEALRDDSGHIVAYRAWVRK
jgi:hypothetical protein